MAFHPVLEGIQAVIFDKDGTLIDHDATWSQPMLDFALAAAGGDVALSHQLLVEQGFDPALGRCVTSDGIAGNTFDVTARRWAQSMNDKGHSDEHVAGALAQVLAAQVTPVALPGVPALLKALRQAGVKVGMATNDSEKGAKDQMSQLGWLEYFDAVVGSDSGYGGKPQPGMILGCARRLGVKAEHCAMVGDTDRDTLAGQAAGVKAIVAVANGNKEVAAQLTQTATIVLDETQDLLLTL